MTRLGPRGYGLMGADAVARVEDSHGDFTFTCRPPGWHAAHPVRLGHLLAFS